MAQARAPRPAGRRRVNGGAAGGGGGAYLPLAAFALLYLAATVLWRLPYWVALVYGAASLLCFAAYALDKAAAVRGRWRTPERTLLILGLACGWPGAILAQQWLRHKSSKMAFRTLFWCTVAANVAAFTWLARWQAA
ncbi:MAG TPA: DUF1294 domain-containing protein [Burkholderiaceae bacterium]|nr:DUF1294 domain-containing protein [Burkholderiaceae bacterium]